MPNASSKGRHSGTLYRKDPPPSLFEPMRDSCHSFLSCDHGHKKEPIREGVKGHWGSRGWGHVVGGKTADPCWEDRGLIQDGGWRSCDFLGKTADPCWEKKIAGSDPPKKKDRTRKELFVTCF